MIEINNINKYFGKKRILKDISINISKGKIVGLVGPNGCGKTTLLKCIVNLLKSNSGNIMINNYDLFKDSPNALNGVGSLIEYASFFNNLRGIDNLKYFNKMFAHKPDKVIEEFVSFLNMNDYINRKFSKYSLGMKQKIGNYKCSIIRR